MGKCKKCGTVVSSPKKKWTIAGRPSKAGKRTRLEIGLFDCPTCKKPFREVLSKKIIQARRRRPKRAKEVASKADVGGEGTRHQVYTPSFPDFSFSSNLFKSSCSSILKTPFSIYRIKHAHETPLLTVKPLLIVRSLNTYHKALDSRGGDFSRTSPFGLSAASPKHHLLQCKGILKI